MFIILIVVLSGTVTGCSAPETTTELTDSIATAISTPITATAASSNADRTLESGQIGSEAATAAFPADPAAASPSGDLTFPELNISQEQRNRFGSFAAAVFNLPEQLDVAQLEDAGILDDLMGIWIVARSLSSLFVDTLNNQDNAAFMEERVDALSPGEQAELAHRAAEKFHLTQDGATLVDLVFNTVTTEYDNQRGVTRLEIPIVQWGELDLADNYVELIEVTARTVNLQTLEEETGQVAVVSARLDKVETFIASQHLVIELSGNIAGWTEIAMKPSIFTNDQGDNLAAHYYHVRGLSGADAVMALRPLIPGQEGRQLLTPPTYGAPEPEYLDPIPENEVAAAMDATARETVQRHVAAGDLTLDEAEALFRRFEEDPTLAAFQPAYKAALQIASIFKPVGGDRLVEAALGDNHSQVPIRQFFESDPELSELFNGNPPQLLGDATMLRHKPDPEAPNGYISVLIVSDKFQYGEEPVHILALKMIHEIMVHDRFDVTQGSNIGYSSLGEESLGSLTEAVIWAKLIQRNPELLRGQTPATQFHNLLLLILLNSRNSHGRHNVDIGLLSEFTLPDYNTLPRNQVESMRSFADFIRYLYRDIDLANVSHGSEHSRHILTAMVGVDDDVLQEIEALDLNQDGYPELSENLIRFLDRHLHRLLTNEEVVEVARLMGLEVQSGSE